MAKKLTVLTFPLIDEISKFVKIKRKKIADKLKKLITEAENYITTIESVNNDLNLEKKQLEDLNESQKNILSESEKQLRALDKKLKTITGEKAEIAEKMNLISTVFAAKSIQNKGLQKFKDVLNNDFMNFANEESSLAEEAKAVLLLQCIEKELEMIVSFSNIYSKNIIAVAGGFSSGKSEFINSFFKENVVALPVGVNPVTAIPTYITNGQKNLIKGYSQKGGVFEISPCLHKKFDHNFIKSFNFKLKDILPVMAVETPLKSYEHICFIDTPGYNPAETEYTDEDKKTASDYVEQAFSVIWMIGLDSNGTIPLSDIQFLDRLNLQNKKLFVVANKADLRPKESVSCVMDEIQQTLENYSFNYEGISAYSSVNKKEHDYRKKSLIEFLDDSNFSTKIRDNLIHKIDSVMYMYKSAIDNDLLKTKKIQKNLKEIELDLVQMSVDSDDNEINNRIYEMQQLFKRSDLKKQLTKLEQIRQDLNNSIVEIFDGFCQ